VILPASRCARGSLSAASALEPASSPSLVFFFRHGPLVTAHHLSCLQVRRGGLGDHLLEVRLGYGRRAVGAGAMPEPDLEEEVVKDVRTKCFFDISHGLLCSGFRVYSLGFRVQGLGLRV
jgi:hypothetical protein